jgi:hypothetical protein
MRVDVGPNSGDPAEDFRLFRSWARELAAGGLLDVLSVGASHLTQSHFFRDRVGLRDGGGLSIRSEDEYATIWKDARPMLVRSQAGTRDIPRLAAIHESSLRIAWHALSFWWCCQLDGRGPYDMRENLAQQFTALRFTASSGKPLEPSVPHHFAFGGADDVTWVVSGYLAAKAAKQAGVRTLILPVMLNFPKFIWGLQDVAKARALRELLKYVEDRHFRIILQPQGGVDGFSSNMDTARIELAALSALMADLDPQDVASPAIINVAVFSEAAGRVDPDTINESIRITRQAMNDYRKLRARGQIENVQANEDLARRIARLCAEARTVINTIEDLVPGPYSPMGFETIFAAGFLPVPWLWDCRDHYPAAVAGKTRLVDGGIQAVDDGGNVVSAASRMALIRENWKGGIP